MNSILYPFPPPLSHTPIFMFHYSMTLGCSGMEHKVVMCTWMASSNHCIYRGQ